VFFFISVKRGINKRLSQQRNSWSGLLHVHNGGQSEGRGNLRSSLECPLSKAEFVTKWDVVVAVKISK
jgi:hypothetical protein